MKEDYRDILEVNLKQSARNLGMGRFFFLPFREQRGISSGLPSAV